jgi:polyisoprenoid-binding protein YceI
MLFFMDSTVAQTVYKVQKSTITLNSDAPNELIKATSKKLKGLVNVSKKQFAFKVEVASFEGFNSPLQREHFNENYMESFRFPDISFSGKIIEDVDLSRDGKYTIRAKGELDIHGVSRDRIIYAEVVTRNGSMDVVSDFRVALADHDIKIPRVVNDKLATEVYINVKMLLLEQQP